MGNPDDGECLAVGCSNTGTLYGMFCSYHSATPEEIGRLRARAEAAEKALATIFGAFTSYPNATDRQYHAMWDAVREAHRNAK
jgi:hypothetical protein